ncbi:MAG: hypothetical protein ACO29X_03560 [Arcobacteraceae bacterium]|jgi:hypothetical protein
MKKIFLVISIFSVILFGKDTLDRKTIQSAAFLNEVASGINQQLPMMLDQETRADSAIGLDKEIVYKYTLVNTNQNDFSPKDLINALKPSIKNSVCTTPSVKIFPENGVKMTYSYYSKDGKFIAEFTITPQDCGFSKNKK